MQRTHLYDRLTPHVLVAPQTPAAGTVNGTGLDAIATSQLVPLNDAVAFVNVGASTGSPTAVSLVCTIQDSADNSTFATALDNRGASVTRTISGTAAAVAGVWALPGYSPNALRRYRRLSIVSSYTGGSSPTTPFSAIEVAGGAHQIA